MTAPHRNHASQTGTGTVELPPLRPGERLDQPTFHARYEAMPRGTRAELVDGVVSMPSPLKCDHGREHALLVGWLMLYHAATPGTDILDNATVILSNRAEPQPDACLRILQEYGGRTYLNEDDYLVGGPEWVGEIALSSEENDLGPKHGDYESAGVLEYLVLALRDRRAVWHAREHGNLVEVDPDDDGIYRSRVFPGLWFDPDAILNGDARRLIDVLQQGLASREHADFVAGLEQRRQA